MIAVVDKKVVKHLVNTDRGLLEVPVRVSFQYDLEQGRFVTGSMERRILYNQDAALRRLPNIDAATLADDIDGVVDRMLVEHLCYSGHAGTDVDLYEEAPVCPKLEIVEGQQPPKVILR